MTAQAVAAGIGLPGRFVTAYSAIEEDDFLQPIPEEHRSKFRRKYQIPEDAVVLITIARLFELKGHEYIIDILSNQPEGLASDLIRPSGCSSATAISRATSRNRFANWDWPRESDSPAYLPQAKYRLLSSPLTSWFTAACVKASPAHCRRQCCAAGQWSPLMLTVQEKW